MSVQSVVRGAHTAGLPLKLPSFEFESNRKHADLHPSLFRVKLPFFFSLLPPPSPPHFISALHHKLFSLVFQIQRKYGAEQMDIDIDTGCSNQGSMANQNNFSNKKSLRKKWDG